MTKIPGINKRVMVKLSDRAEFLATVIGENTDDPDSYYHTYQVQERNGRIHWVRQNQTRKI